MKERSSVCRDKHEEFELTFGSINVFFLMLNFDFRFGQEVKVKLGSPFCKRHIFPGDPIARLVSAWCCDARTLSQSPQMGSSPRQDQTLEKRA